MAPKFLHPKILWALVLGLTVSFCLGSMGPVEARKKVKFKYNTPAVEKWVNYCERRHAGEPLTSCCQRRVEVCKKRCKKSRFPNTAYTSSLLCQKACTTAASQCTKKVKARISHGRDTAWEPKENPWNLPFHTQCKKKHRRNKKASRMTNCCSRKIDRCQAQCSRKFKTNPEKRTDCEFECGGFGEYCYRG